MSSEAKAEICDLDAMSVIWTRAGDYYVVTGPATTALAKTLSVVLQKGNGGPEFGIPVVRADEYMRRTIKAGYRIANVIN